MNFLFIRGLVVGLAGVIFRSTYYRKAFLEHLYDITRIDTR